MNARYRLVVFCLSLASLLAACNLPANPGTATPSQGNLETMVAATLTAHAVEVTSTPTAVPATPTQASSPTPAFTLTPTFTPPPTATPLPTTGKVFGQVCYLVGADIPAMSAYFQETRTNAVVQVPIAAGQITYTVTLTPGNYVAYAWLPDFSRGGMYTVCGGKKGCSDHSALAFAVRAGDRLSGIDLCDWYAGPFNVPYPPGYKPEQTVGSISGTAANYPGDNVPILTVVATNVKTGYWYYWQTGENNPYFVLEKLPPGTYHVVAYAENGKAGGYADSGHHLLDVIVKPGEDVYVVVNDWEGDFPSSPVK